MDTIDLRTSQHVTISYAPASTVDRVVAFVLDWLLVSVSYWVLASILGTLFYLIGESGGRTLSLGYIFYLLSYFFLNEWLSNGQTVGKRIMQLRVVRLDARPLGASDVLLRTVFTLVDSLFCLGLLAILLIAGTERRQRLGDLAANTTVLKIARSDRFSLDSILSIKSLDDYDVQYPQVTRLGENDMLVVKSALVRYRRYPNRAHAEAVDLLVRRLAGQLDIPVPKTARPEFLRTLLEDYIVLTR